MTTFTRISLVILSTFFLSATSFARWGSPCMGACEYGPMGPGGHRGGPMVCASASGGCGYGQMGVCPVAQGGDGFFLGLAEELKLTDKQVVSLNALRNKSRRDIGQKRMKLDLAQDALTKLVHDRGSKKKDLERAIEDVTKAEKALLEAQVMSSFEARGLLTKEQLATLPPLRASASPKDRPCCPMTSGSSCASSKDAKSDDKDD